MASIFQNAVKFIGATLKQAATIDYLRDYRHANTLFVGGNYRLMPKNAHLFHVAFDLNPRLTSTITSERSSVLELGLMVKSIELPKFSIETKLYNAYNRPNYVMSKIKYDPVTINFHDDSMNTIRNFWYDYYRYYFRDSDTGYGTGNATNTYNLPHKYDNGLVNTRFGFTRRVESSENFITAIRIYSLHQKRFSEYTLINPIIKKFNHGQHSYDSTDLVGHDMTIEYESVLYADGAVGSPTIKGFAQLHYDTTRSPLGQIGGVKSIFGSGGLFDTAGSVISDVSNGNYLSAIFKTARTINTFRGTNLKKAAVSELTKMYTSAATGAVVGLIKGNANGYNVISPNNQPNALSPNNAGIFKTDSVLALAGAAVFLNSTPITNKYKQNPTIQSNRPKSQAAPLPLVPNATVTPTASLYPKIVNDMTKNETDTNQFVSYQSGRITDIDTNIRLQTRKSAEFNNRVSYLSKQIAENTTIITGLNQKYATFNVGTMTPAKVQLLADIKRQITETQNTKNINQAELNRVQDLANKIQLEINRLINERNSLT